jgi:hypothetical protein
MKKKESRTVGTPGVRSLQQEFLMASQPLTRPLFTKSVGRDWSAWRRGVYLTEKDQQKKGRYVESLVG